MAYDLAERWGIPDVEAWRRTIDPAVLSRWIVYYRVRANEASQKQSRSGGGSAAMLPQTKAAELFASVGKR